MGAGKSRLSSVDPLSARTDDLSIKSLLGKGMGFKLGQARQCGFEFQPCHLIAVGNSGLSITSGLICKTGIV